MDKQDNLEDYVSFICEVKTLSNYLIDIGYISEAGENFIEISSKSDKMLLERANSKVKIIIYNKDLGRRILMGTVYLSTDEFMKIIDLETLAEFEKRKYFRVNVNMLTAATQLNEQQDEDKAVNAADIPIKIEDISLGGVMFKSSSPVNIGDKFVIHFPILNHQVSFTAQVCRLYNEDNTISCGCEFLDPSEKDLDFLYKYLLEEQSSQIRSRKNS